MSQMDSDPLGVSLLVELPPETSEEQAKLLATALKRTVLDFSKALGVDEKLKVSSVSGPAKPAITADIGDGKKLPGLLAKQARVARPGK